MSLAMPNQRKHKLSTMHKVAPSTLIKKKDQIVSRTLPVYAKVFGGLNKRLTLDCPTGMTLGQFQNTILYMHPEFVISRILFAGMPLRDDTKTLGEFGYCTLVPGACAFSSFSPSPLYVHRSYSLCDL